MLQTEFFHKAKSIFSLKLTLALILTFPSIVMSAQTTQADIDRLMNFNPRAEIEQAIRNREALEQQNARRDPANPRWTCNGKLTNEQTGTWKKVTVPTFGTGVETTQTATEYHFEEQDDTGATSLTINKRTRKGSVTIFDANGRVTHTGSLSNCR
ncbi:hypothetical protein [Klebsiella pneumoniae]|uniref:hypothetical protein n=1 Tax=Klebsiella pneumoniae TaxID=573 RepID=UPI0023810C2B|nr:hypothetical protein [Klebsiella pneumoniae]MDE4788950.1 hypothetical protein [Klebsiella pneumoniae]